MKTEPIKNPSSLLDVERLVYHAERPGFQIAELQLSPSQKVPWHFHTEVQDTFYVLHGRLRIFMQTPKKTSTWHPVRHTQWGHAVLTL